MRRAVLAAAAATLLTACGGHSVAGRAVFVRACSGCHSVTGHDTNAAGGDLGANRLTVGQIESFVRVMPVKLTPAETRAVAGYVAKR